MLTLPVAIIKLLEPFETLFDYRTWEKAQLLLVGAILAPGKRTVSSALRIMGLTEEANFAQYHHVLNRASWSPLPLSGVLVRLLMRHLGGVVARTPVTWPPGCVPRRARAHAWAQAEVITWSFA